MKKMILYMLMGFIQVASVNAQNAQYVSAATQNAEQCNNAISSNPALTPIKNKVAFDIKQQSIVMLTDKSKPTAKEKVAILAWEKSIQECIKLWQVVLDERKITGDVRKAQNAWIKANQYLLADLYAGKLTYGQFANIRNDIEIEAENMIARISQEQKRQAQEDAQRNRALVQEESYRNRSLAAQEMQSRAAIAAAQDAASTNLIIQGAQILNSTVRPVAPAVVPSNTTCIQQGVFTNCRTY